MVKSEEGSPFTYPSPFAIRPSPFTRLFAPHPSPFTRGNQPHPPLEREIGVRPLDEDDRAIAESHEVHDVHEKPEEPRRVAGESHVAEHGDGAIAPDDGQLAQKPAREASKPAPPRPPPPPPPAPRPPVRPSPPSPSRPARARAESDSG